MPYSLRWFFSFVALVAIGAPGVAASAPRERAIEQIPELMGRILESQEEIQAAENEMKPVVQRYDQKLTTAKLRIEEASSEPMAAEALVDYVEAYASRLEAQEAGLRSIESAVVRMRADARDLTRAARVAGSGGRGETREERQAFHGEQFQGVAAATGELAERLERQDEAVTAAAVLHASWSSRGAIEFPFQKLGPEAAVAFARRVEGLYARYQARSNQLVAEKRSVRRLLDVLIERQLAQRLDALFAGGDSVGLGALLAGEGKSQDWQDLGAVVSRTLGLPSGAGGVGFEQSRASLEKLDYFASGAHRN